MKQSIFLSTLLMTVNFCHFNTTLSADDRATSSNQSDPEHTQSEYKRKLKASQDIGAVMGALTSSFRALRALATDGVEAPSSSQDINSMIVESGSIDAIEKSLKDMSEQLDMLIIEGLSFTKVKFCWDNLDRDILGKAKKLDDSKARSGQNVLMYLFVCLHKAQIDLQKVLPYYQLNKEIVPYLSYYEATESHKKTVKEAQEGRIATPIIESSSSFSTSPNAVLPTSPRTKSPLMAELEATLTTLQLAQKLEEEISQLAVGVERSSKEVYSSSPKPSSSKTPSPSSSPARGRGFSVSQKQLDNSLVLQKKPAEEDKLEGEEKKKNSGVLATLKKRADSLKRTFSGNGKKDKPSSSSSSPRQSRNSKEGSSSEEEKKTESE